MSSDSQNPKGGPDRGDLERQLQEALSGGTGSKVARAAINIIGGAIPFAGGILGAATGAWSEKEQDRFNRIFAEWMKLHEAEIHEIGITMMEILVRLHLNDEQVRQRIESPEYQALIRKAFRDWSAAESEEKRTLIRKLLCNAAASRITTDDVIKLFIEWIREYSELHFRVIRELFTNPFSTRADMWQAIHGVPVREDSAEADLFKLLISDLCIGHVIRQRRETDQDGNFLRAQQPRPRTQSRTLTSAFEDGKPYVLTALGSQFVHYTMNEIIPKIADASV